MKFTFKEDKTFIPVAKIVNADKINNEIIFLDPSIGDSESDEENINSDIRNINFKKYIDVSKKLKPRESMNKLNELSDHIKNNHKPLKTDMLEAYNKIKSDGKREFQLKNGNFIPIGDINKERLIYYIFGASGSGKTHLCSKILKEWMKLNPNNDVFVFSKLKYDKVIDDLGKQIKRIDIDTMKDEPVTMEELKDGSMVLFDDIDCLEGDKEIFANLQKLQSTIYTTGRHNRISAIATSHLGSDYKKSRLILSEANYIVVYPSSGSFYQISYVLKNYMGVDTEEIKKIKKLKSRWVLCSRNFPQYILSENTCYLL